MNRDEIDEVVWNIFRHDGPDGHVDGSEIVTDFVIAIRDGKEEEWRNIYKKKLGAKWEPFE